MLSFLKIKNIALIDELEINFENGLNVITGETGAGKSIIIDSLNFVIGGKINKGIFRSGSTFVSVEAIFSNVNEEVKTILADFDIECDDEVLIKRKQTIEGKNEIRVNGSTVTVTMLKNITSKLVDIHGQHEHQAILQDKYHLQMLDNLLEEEIFTLKEEVAEEYSNLLAINKEIKTLGSSAANRERMLDLLQYQINEIEKAKLKPGEDDELTNRRMVMLNGERIATALKNACDYLDGDFSSVVDSLKKANSELSNIIKFDESLDLYKERIESSRLELLDVSESLKDYLQTINFDQKEFDEIDARLDQIKLLKKKYGSTVEEVLAFLEKSKKEYDNLINSNEKIEKLFIEKRNKIALLYKLSKSLSEKRKTFAKTLEKTVCTQLVDLGMKNAKFIVDFNDAPTLDECENLLNANGYDVVKFMFSANLGQDIKPLADIISGGEASRFMLALKNIMADADKIATLVFDEIDTGVSGNMGYMVACKLANISKNHQVISVSHLPQICAMADAGYRSTKYVEDNLTKTKIERLKENEMLNEISRLSGGVEESNATAEHSKELRARCIDYKKSIN